MFGSFWILIAFWHIDPVVKRNRPIQEPTILGGIDKNEDQKKGNEDWEEKRDSHKSLAYIFYVKGLSERIEMEC